MNISHASKRKGAALISIVLLFLVVATTLLVGIMNPIAFQIRNANEFLNSKQSYSLADAQAENALYRFNNGRSDAPSTLSLLGVTASANMTDIGEIKQITVEGINQQFERVVQAQFRQDAGVAFNYGLQSGIGGVEMEGSSYITGNVYSNGDIVGNGGNGWYNNYITGSAIVANISDQTPHIDNATIASTTDTTHIMGTSNTNQDFAQSFVYGTTSPITEAQIYLKKVGSPANATVKIVNDSSGQPGTTILSSGTLSSSLATTLYSYVPSSMNTTTSLVPGTTYWMVIDMPSSNNSNYYILQLNNNTFSGSVKNGRLGNSWSDIATTTADVKFKILSGGDTGSITGIGVGTSGTGVAWAHTATNVTATGALYCQMGSGNNKTCDMSRSDPAPTNMPVSQGNMDEWKSLATAGGATSSIKIDGNNVRTIGPIKINGNLEVEAGGTLYITGPIYVTGFIKVSGNGKIYVHSSMGTASGIVVADGIVELEGSGGIYGSGQAGSYVVVATTSTCPGGSNCTGGSRAIKISGAAGSVVLVAPDGTVELEGSVSIKSLVAKKVKMSGASNIIYDSGLADLDFTSGPSGSWTVESWKEVEGN